MTINTDRPKVDRALMEDMRREARSTIVTVSTVSNKPQTPEKVTLDRDKIMKAIGERAPRTS